MRCIKKNKMYKKSLINHQLINDYKKYKKCLSRVLKYVEKKYYETEIMGKNIKDTWKSINYITGKNNNKLIKIDNNSSDLENSNMFNNYFSKIGYELNKNVKSSNIDIFKKYYIQ